MTRDEHMREVFWENSQTWTFPKKIPISNRWTFSMVNFRVDNYEDYPDRKSERSKKGGKLWVQKREPISCVKFFSLYIFPLSHSIISLMSPKIVVVSSSYFFTRLYDEKLISIFRERFPFDIFISNITSSSFWDPSKYWFFSSSLGILKIETFTWILWSNVWRLNRCRIFLEKYSWSTWAYYSGCESEKMYARFVSQWQKDLFEIYIISELDDLRLSGTERTSACCGIS